MGVEPPPPVRGRCGEPFEIVVRQAGGPIRFRPRNNPRFRQAIRMASGAGTPPSNRENWTRDNRSGPSMSAGPSRPPGIPAPTSKPQLTIGNRTRRLSSGYFPTPWPTSNLGAAHSSGPHLGNVRFGLCCVGPVSLECPCGLSSHFTISALALRFVLRRRSRTGDANFFWRSAPPAVEVRRAPGTRGCPIFLSRWKYAENRLRPRQQPSAHVRAPTVHTPCPTADGAARICHRRIGW